MFKRSIVALALFLNQDVQGVQLAHRHHHHHHHESIPACNSWEFAEGKCKVETAAPHKLQADMDKHPKDYFVPNFGMDREIKAS